MLQLSSAQVLPSPDTYSTCLLYHCFMAAVTEDREQPRKAYIGCPWSNSVCDDNDVFPASC